MAQQGAANGAGARPNLQQQQQQQQSAAANNNAALLAAMQRANVAGHQLVLQA